MHAARQAYPDGFSRGLQPCGDVNAVAKQFAAICHHVAEIDANPERHL